MTKKESRESEDAVPKRGPREVNRFIDGAEDDKLADYALRNGMHESTVKEIFRQRTTLGLDPKTEIERYVKTFGAGGPEPTKSFKAEPIELEPFEAEIASQIRTGKIKTETIL